MCNEVKETKETLSALAQLAKDLKYTKKKAEAQFEWNRWYMVTIYAFGALTIGILGGLYLANRNVLGWVGVREMTPDEIEASKKAA